MKEALKKGYCVNGIKPGAAQSESGRISGRMASWADEEAIAGTRHQRGGGGQEGRERVGGMISRMLVFESEAVYVASKGGDSILLSSRRCFTVFFANGTHRQHVTKYAPAAPIHAKMQFCSKTPPHQSHMKDATDRRNTHLRFLPGRL